MAEIHLIGKIDGIIFPMPGDERLQSCRAFYDVLGGQAQGPVPTYKHE